MIETTFIVILVVCIAAWFLYTIHMSDQLDNCKKENKYLRKRIEEK